MVLAGVVGVEMAVRRRDELLDAMPEGRERVRTRSFDGVIPLVERGMALADPGVEQEQPTITGTQEVGDDDALLVRPVVVRRERERARVERQDLPEVRVGHGSDASAGSEGRS